MTIMIAQQEGSGNIPMGRLLQAYDDILSDGEMENEYDEQRVNRTSNWIALVCLGICIFVFVVCIQSMRNGYSETVLLGRAADKIHPEAKEITKEMLADMFAKSGNQMELQPANFTRSCDVESGDVETEDGELILVTTKDEKKAKNKQTSVPNCCAICLDPYKPGEFIVWSASRECPHAYHRHCMIDYLISIPSGGMSKGGSPCPSCRQEFCHCSPPPCDIKNSTDEIA
eukprot:CAMPEP_0117014622 /NCGR_PEP_ID=MMETSP0472-20121206/11828_1 /TAXON_ID=693140 ORGANISM="Tiarina fusus, Strain LIS" /NCGR_SAMPLE_ID=MMETSP0472 /ASSEMBLY_ACC=CAM_ASM_000603 /LENGTH=228 /DNA_ID=CAMNT_0004718227 /DNA_START=144 /DNA_END=830 /DNA_ORIENTATION=-